MVSVAALSSFLCTCPVTAQQFTNVTEAAGVGDVHEADPLGSSCVFDMTYLMNSGCVFGDFNNDSQMDLYLADGGGYPNVLYRNNGDGTFSDVTERTGVGDLSRSMGVGFGDIDNNGWQDIYVSNLGQPNKLYLNQRGGIFREISAQAGVDDDRFNTALVLDDFNKDGWIDIYVSAYGPICDIVAEGNPFLGSSNVLYLNNGDGMTFTDVTGSTSAGGGTRWSLAVTSGDVDNDGDQDIYVANDFEGGNALLINELGEQGGLQFSDKSDEYRVAISGNMMSSTFGDIDNDGDLDLYSSNIREGRPQNPDRFNGNALLRNEYPNDSFTDISLESGANPGRWSWGSVFLDVDFDGRLDIFAVNGWPFIVRDPTFDQPNYLFRNIDGTQFEEIGQSLGIDKPRTSDGDLVVDSRGLAKADIDNDGDEDVYVRNNRESGVLFRNDYAGPNHWLQVEARGRTSNHFAIGTRFQVSAGGITRTGYVTGGHSFLSQSSPIVTFGLGEATIVDSLVVLWPAGGREVFTDLQVDRRHLIVESPRIDTSIPSELDNSGVRGSRVESSTVELQSISEGIRVIYNGAPGALVDVSVYNLLGQRTFRFPGGVSVSRREAVWHGTDQYGQTVGNGVYFVRVLTDTEVLTDKVVLMR